jgi:hypothetical protein
MLGACHSREFQTLVSMFNHGFVLPAYPMENKYKYERLIDLCNLLTGWNILVPQYEVSIPDGLTPSDQEGIPAGLLPFLLARFPIPDETHEDFKMHENAAEMLHCFWECIDSLRSKGSSVLVCNVAPKDQDNFVTAADQFISSVVSKLYPDTQQVVEQLRIKIPIAFDRFEKGDEEGTNEFIRLKALFYGIHGISVALPNNGRLRLRRRLLSRLNAY